MNVPQDVIDGVAVAEPAVVDAGAVSTEEASAAQAEAVDPIDSLEDVMETTNIGDNVADAVEGFGDRIKTFISDNEEFLRENAGAIKDLANAVGKYLDRTVANNA